LPGFKTVSFQELGLIPQPSVIRGRDGARSTALWGKSVWTFNTTVLNQADVDGRNWHNNSFATTDDMIKVQSEGTLTPHAALEKLRDDSRGGEIALFRAAFVELWRHHEAAWGPLPADVK